MPRSTLYRKLQAPKIAGTRKKTKPRRALSAEERKLVLDVLHAPRFIDKPPAQVYAALLDEGVYLCSISESVAASTPLERSMRARYCAEQVAG